MRVRNGRATRPLIAAKSGSRHSTLFDPASREGPGPSWSSRPQGSTAGRLDWSSSSQSKRATTVSRTTFPMPAEVSSAPFAMPEYVRSLGRQRLRHRLGVVEEPTLIEVGNWLRRIIAL